MIKQKNEKIKAIISDIGNVIVPVNLSLWVSLFEEIGVYLPGHPMEDKALLALVELYCTGGIDTREFKAQVAKQAGLRDIPFEHFCPAWNKVILSIRQPVIDGLKALQSQGYRLYALSDINELHIAYIEELYNPGQSMATFSQLFDACYYSHLTGYTKGSDEAWLKILNDHDLKPSECFFIDDYPSNIERATRLGFPVFHFQPDSTIEDVTRALETL